MVITGQTSGATAVVSNALSTAEGGDAITEFEINPASLSGTFVDGEIIQATSTVQDVTMSFTVRGIVTSYAVTDGGKLYSVGDDLNLDTQTAIGNGEALAEVGSIKTGSVSRVVVAAAGVAVADGVADVGVGVAAVVVCGVAVVRLFRWRRMGDVDSGCWYASNADWFCAVAWCSQATAVGHRCDGVCLHDMVLGRYCQGIDATSGSARCGIRLQKN